MFTEVRSTFYNVYKYETKINIKVDKRSVQKWKICTEISQKPTDLIIKS
jgi:hypothetical protein